MFKSGLKLNGLSRRKFFALGLLGAPALMAADAKWIEPTWLNIRKIKLSPAPRCRFAQFSDVHHKGDRDYLQKVIQAINALDPDFVCFTGDIVEQQKFLGEALDLFALLKAPVFGIPGNHDYWSGCNFQEIDKRLKQNGGGWLMDREVKNIKPDVNLIGLSCAREPKYYRFSEAPLRILMYHYPEWVKKLNGQKFDLMLAGHSHGGQVRLPFYGALLVPFHVGAFDMGMYQTEAGPLYVNPGIGYLDNYNIRFCCRPEVTYFEI